MSSPTSQKRELPVGWLLTLIGEIAETIRGVTYKKENSSLEAKGGLIPILRATNIGDGLDFEELVYVPPDNVSAAQFLRLNDIVIAASSGSRAIVGKAAILSSEWTGSFGAFCYALRPNPLINARLLAYFLQTSEYRNQVSNMSAGVNINNLRREHIENIPYRLAPNDEQARIVEEIDEQFTRLDAAASALKRIQANLKRYRAAVLKAACEGRFVPTEAELARREGRSYEPASVLLERILADRRSRWEAVQLAKYRRGGKASNDDGWKRKYKDPLNPAHLNDTPRLPDGWCWITADQCTTMVTDGEHITPERSESGVLLLSARNVLNGKLSLADVDHIPESVYQQLSRRLSIEAGDVLLSCSGTVGRSCIAPEGLRFSLVRSVAVLKPIFEMGAYLSLALRSPFLQSQILTKQTQTAQANIFQGKIKTLIFPLPPLAEQTRILVETDRRLSVMDELETQVRANLKRGERLRQSILKRAFEGLLVPQEPSDEPASVLLERVRTERNNRPEAIRRVRKGGRTQTEQSKVRQHV